MGSNIFISVNTLKIESTKWLETETKEEKLDMSIFELSLLVTSILRHVPVFENRPTNFMGLIQIKSLKNINIEPKVCVVLHKLWYKLYEFSTLSLALFAFEQVNDVDVCFFGLHVQEYGSECPSPNNRRVYIGYLDSVKFFQPAYLRTDVYHELLISK